MTGSLITVNTKICGFIGDPISHSVGPAMLNAAFRERKLDYIFVAFQVSREQLAQAISGMRALNIKGLNVTRPHKVAVLSLLDEIDELALKIGAVNTIVNDNGVLKGYNTDASGFLQALKEGGFNPQEKRVVVLGAGGVARAISYVIAAHGASLSIFNRHLARAEELSLEIARHFGVEITALELNEANLAGALGQAELLINATSVGTIPEFDATLVPARLLRKELVVFDVVYNPVKTRLLTEAEEKGAHVISGLDMLVCQGIPVFEMWTGDKAPVEIMKREARRALGYSD